MKYYQVNNLDLFENTKPDEFLKRNSKPEFKYIPTQNNNLPETMKMQSTRIHNYINKNIQTEYHKILILFQH